MRAAFERQVLDLYDALLDRPESERATWLRAATGSDPVLTGAVQALVDADVAAAILPTEPIEPRPPLDDAPAPARIGQYRIAGEIGRGGMGVVYLADRDDGLFEHRVAIKLIRRVANAEQALAQFAVERRILARLRHPHIAQLLDGGATQDGASYIVMELIGGEPITGYCRARGLGLPARLALFAQAAEAIEHAHRNLIVHADIKPSNVVVEDGFGVKLLDFGIARLLSDSDSQHGTGFTPGYASPARAAGLPPTPADDVYAAGVLLRTLLNGVPGGDDDLAAIVAKAIADDPVQRYGAIGELADDLARWQSHRPIRAAPPGRARRAILMWRRHRLGLTLGAAILAGLIAVIVVTASLYIQSERRRILADRRFTETRGIANYVVGEIDPELARLPGSLQLRRRLVSEMGRYLAALEADRASSGALKLDAAAGYLRLARIYGLDPSGGIGDFARARESLAHAQALLRTAAAQHPDANKLLLVEAEAKVVAGAAVFVAADAAGVRNGLAALLSAETLLRRYLATVPDDMGARLELWRAQIMSGRAYSYLDQPDAGRRAVEQGLGNARLRVRSVAERETRDYLLNASYLMLAEASQWSDPRRAIAFHDKLVAHVAAMRARRQSDWQNDFLQASALSGRAALLARLGERERAVRDYHASIDLRGRLLAEDDNHEIATAQSYVEYMLADLKAQMGDLASARAISDTAIAWLRRDLADAPGSPERLRLLAMMLADRGSIEHRASRRGAACAFDRRASAMWRRVQDAGGELPLDSRSGEPLAELRDRLDADCAT